MKVEINGARNIVQLALQCGAERPRYHKKPVIDSNVMQLPHNFEDTGMHDGHVSCAILKYVLPMHLTIKYVLVVRMQLNPSTSYFPHTFY